MGRYCPLKVIYQPATNPLAMYNTWIQASSGSLQKNEKSAVTIGDSAWQTCMSSPNSFNSIQAVCKKTTGTVDPGSMHHVGLSSSGSTVARHGSRDRRRSSKVCKLPWKLPDCPWSRLHIDIGSPVYNHMFLVVVDAYSKWIEVAIMNTPNS